MCWKYMMCFNKVKITFLPLIVACKHKNGSSEFTASSLYQVGFPHMNDVIQPPYESRSQSKSRDSPRVYEAPAQLHTLCPCQDVKSCP